MDKIITPKPIEAKGNSSNKKYIIFFVVVLVLFLIVLIIPSPKKEKEDVNTSINVEKPQTPQVEQTPQTQPQTEQPTQQLPDLKEGISLPEPIQQPTTQQSTQLEVAQTQNTQNSNNLKSNLKTLGKNLNLRETPEGKIIEELKRGSQVEVVDTSLFPWIKVKHKDKEGYIYTCNIFEEVNAMKDKTEKKIETVKSIKDTGQGKKVTEKVVKKEKEEKEEAETKIDTQKLSIVCSKKDCVLYDKGVAYKVGEAWKGYTIKSINLFSIDIEKNGKVYTINLE